MTGCGIMSSVWDMILQGGSTIKVSIELPVATRQRRDMTEKLLKATLIPNTRTRNWPRWLWERARSRSQTLESAQSVQLFLGFIYIPEVTEVAIRVYDMSFIYFVTNEEFPVR